MSVEIELNSSQIAQAAHVGILRHISALQDSRSNLHGTPETPWERHIEGACGELAVAKYLGAFWDGNIGKIDCDDIGHCEVRTTTREDGHLLINGSAKPERAYVLVVGAAPRYSIRGWMWSHDAMTDRYLNRREVIRQGRKIQMWWVPQGDLRPPKDLFLLPGSAAAPGF